MALLEVSDLRATFATDQGTVHAVDGVSFAVERGRVLGIVGESGSGKSVTSLAIMGLLGRSATVTGSVRLDGRELLGLREAALRRIRGKDVAMVFQDPMTSLNPVYTIGWQIEEAVRLHGDASRSTARARAIEMLDAVGIPDPDARLASYPHEFSGGMRQRVMIAMALANEPSLLIADEPTTALDVTTQAQILALLRRLRQQLDSAVILVTHDLGVVAEVCDDVLVMYGGRVVEHGTVERLFAAPRHPYTWGLLGSLPNRARAGDRLLAIPGTPPSALDPPPGCPFAPRCRYVMDACLSAPPALTRAPGEDAFHLDACLLDPAVKDRHARQLLGTATAVEASR